MEDWKLLTERIGYFVDTDDAYWTMSPAYIQSVWWHLAQLYERGLLFEDVKVVPYCARCGTALSSHELGQPEVYREVADVAAYVRFPLAGTYPCRHLAEARALVVWTTTPWTLPSNTAVAVGDDIDYVVVDGLVVAAERADAVLGDGALVRGPRLVCRAARSSACRTAARSTRWPCPPAPAPPVGRSCRPDS